MNTAKMREKAKLYESRLDWHNAALCWADAIALLPNHGGSALYERDLVDMRQRQAMCENYAKAALKEHCHKLTG